MNSSKKIPKNDVYKSIAFQQLARVYLGDFSPKKNIREGRSTHKKRSIERKNPQQDQEHYKMINSARSLKKNPKVKETGFKLPPVEKGKNKPIADVSKFQTREKVQNQRIKTDEPASKKTPFDEKLPQIKKVQSRNEQISQQKRVKETKKIQQGKDVFVSSCQNVEEQNNIHQITTKKSQSKLLNHQKNISQEKNKQKDQDKPQEHVEQIKKTTTEEIEEKYKHEQLKQRSQEPQISQVKEQKNILQEKQISIRSDEEIEQKAYTERLRQQQEQIPPQMIKQGYVSVRLLPEYTSICGQTSLVTMLSLKSKGGLRTSVDLICVLDVSGSMKEDNRIKLLKETILLLINGKNGQRYLSEDDRLSIITFSSKCTKVCGLEPVTNQSRQNLSELVSNIQAKGGTDINGGLSLALEVLRQKQGSRDTTSILLLSDGVNKGADQEFKKTLKKKQNRNIKNYSLHCFGLGDGHDEELMTNIAQMKRGEFYFVNRSEEIVQAFGNVFSGLISNAITQLVAQVRITTNEDVYISRIYGEHLWEIKNGQYVMRLGQMPSGVEKNFVFVLQIPNLKVKKSTLLEIGQVILVARGGKKKQIRGKSQLRVKIQSSEEKVALSRIEQVTENYLRVQAAEAIEQAITLADEKQYNQAQELLKYKINDVKQKVKSQNLHHLITDIEQLIPKCQAQLWEKLGRKVAKNTSLCHMMQSNYSYASSFQKSMVSKMIF